MSRLAEVLAPIAALVAVGYALGRWRRLDLPTLSAVTIYLFTPAIVFRSLAGSAAGGGPGPRLVLFTLAHAGVMLALGAIAWTLLRWPARRAAPLLVAVMIYNAGNFGLPANQFAFGDEGLRLAAYVFVTTSVLMSTVGIFLASWNHRGARGAALAVVRLPLLYAAALALVVRWAGITLPPVLARPIDLLAGGAIPLLLVMLGVQLAVADRTALSAEVSLAVGLRLVVSPVVAVLLAAALGMSGVARNVAILQAAMPSAVNAFVLAREFDARAAEVAAAVFLSTILSFVTVGVVLTWLG